MKQLFFTTLILVTVFSSFSFTPIKNTFSLEKSSKTINYIQAYVVNTVNNTTLYFQQYDCAEQYINEFGGIITGTATVKETQAFSCAF